MISVVRLFLFDGTATLLELLHELRMARPVEAAFLWLVIGSRRDVVAALDWRFVFFGLERILLYRRIAAHAGHLPGDFHAGDAGLDAEPMVLDLARHDRLGECADHREL